MKNRYVEMKEVTSFVAVMLRLTLTGFTSKLSRVSFSTCTHGDAKKTKNDNNDDNTEKREETNHYMNEWMRQMVNATRCHSRLSSTQGNAVN